MRGDLQRSLIIYNTKQICDRHNRDAKSNSLS